MVRLLSNCSNTATYEYTDEDVKNFSALESELKACKTSIKITVIKTVTNFH